MVRLLHIIAFPALILATTAAATQPVVSNVVAAPDPAGPGIVVSFDIADPDTTLLTVTLWHSLDGGATWGGPCLSVTGDVGTSVSPATGLTAIWDYTTDLPGTSITDVLVRVYADDLSGYPVGYVDGLLSGPIGSPEDEPGRQANEQLHHVCFDNTCFLKATEVTNEEFAETAQWAIDNGYARAFSASQLLKDFVGDERVVLCDFTAEASKLSYTAWNNKINITPGYESTPVRHVTWYGAAAYCNWMSLRAGLPPAYDHNTWECNGGDPYAAQGYRLPTEAEWEISCRGFDGFDKAYFNGDVAYTSTNPSICVPDSVLAQIGWYCDNSSDPAGNPVASLIPNDLGLYDMHGNAREWVDDWYAYYSVTYPCTENPHVSEGLWKISRGGDGTMWPGDCRSARRYVTAIDAPGVSFRPAITAYGLFSPEKGAVERPADGREKSWH